MLPARLRESIEVAIEPFEIGSLFAIMYRMVVFFYPPSDIPQSARILSLIADSTPFEFSTHSRFYTGMVGFFYPRWYNPY